MQDLLLRLHSCPKGYTKDLEKACSPAQTLARVRERFAKTHLSVVREAKRIDTGRLGIPVYMSLWGKDAQALIPSRKQMGKGSSPEQAEASAIMEAVERFSFFHFFAEKPLCQRMLYPEAKARFGKACVSIQTIQASVNDTIDPALAEALFATIPWWFCPASDLTHDELCWLPIDWFRLINEFNGASAGNTEEESVLQGLCELIERHVCAIIDQTHPNLPTISTDSCTDPTLCQLLRCFSDQGIHLILKDFSLDMPLPTVGALAWDPSTWPNSSEIVFTAGTATSPEKAAIRALTEVAQLAGDFATNACYEASALTKYHNLTETTWLTKECPAIPLSHLPSQAAPDIADELRSTIAALKHPVFTVRTTHPQLAIPAHYTIIPGFLFRERDPNQCLGLFVGRKLVESDDPATMEYGIQLLQKAYPNAHFLPFFHAMATMRQGDFPKAEQAFAKAQDCQPNQESQALACFYQAYCASQYDNWAASIAPLEKAVALDGNVKEYWNLLGVALFKSQSFAKAKTCFSKALAIDKGSAMDMANLGLCEKALGEVDEAIKHLTLAQSLDPSLTFVTSHINEMLHKD
ncbi:MAG: YcaO-like family protein [Desulfovibrio sp.]|nr:YcaO-like family protein [Desulfovibrio sp.]